MTALLEVRGLRAGYGELTVVHGIDLDVNANTVTVMRGSNGAGKTTTLSVLAGLLAPISGTVVFDGVELGHCTTAERVQRGVVLVPEGRRLFGGLSVADNLAAGAWTRRRDAGAATTQTDRILRVFPRLGQRATQRAGTLSGGEQQMLAIGRALMAQPRLLLLDEASLGLSAAMATTVYTAVRDLAREGMAVLLVDQRAEAIEYADDVITMDRGNVVEG
jgi:branched-chain amino acid transport system ATP-binding protein